MPLLNSHSNCYTYAFTQCHIKFMASKEFGISVPLPESFPKVTQRSQQVFLTSTQVVTALQRDPERLALLFVVVVTLFWRH